MKNTNESKSPILKVIATIETDFPTKFGIPRQSGLAATRGMIHFLPEFRNPDALRGIEGYSHLWLIWGFSENPTREFTPTVRPPRLGGNRRMGVFATRSPFRPNPLGLSSVRLLEVSYTEKDGPVLTVEGADLLDGTPIYDIKPYLSFTDSHADAVCGFADEVKGSDLEVFIPKEIEDNFSAEYIFAVKSILKEDPRPHYQEDPTRIYGFPYGGYEIRFYVSEGLLTVVDILPEHADAH